MDISSLDNYMNAVSQSADSGAADSLVSSVKGIGRDSTYEELENATKSFEAYFVEQVIKEFKESLDEENEDEDSSVSQIKDMYMDKSISTIAEEMVSKYGGSITKQLTDSIARNYGIDIPDKKA